jgi:hypothetical protein
MPDVRCQMPDVRCQMSDARCAVAGGRFAICIYLHFQFSFLQSPPNRQLSRNSKEVREFLALVTAYFSDGWTLTTDN